VVCHDILGQTALVDLAGLRDAIAEQGGDPAQVNPVVPVQLIVDHSLAVECGGFDPTRSPRTAPSRTAATKTASTSSTGPSKAFKNVDVIPPGNGIMHQINLEKMSPVVYVQDGVAFPDTCVGTDSHTPHVDALGVIAIGVGGLEAENVMLGRASWMRLPDIVAWNSPASRSRHHRHRRGAGADRVPAQERKSGRRLPGVLRRRRRGA
jgi:aconitate hydratase